MTGTDEKFYFDLNSFDEEEVGPVDVTYTEEEMESAKRQAFEEGKKNAFRQIEQATQETLQGLHVDLMSLVQKEGERQKSFKRDVLSLVTETVRLVLPRLIEKHGLEELENHLREILDGFETTEGVVVRVAEDVQNSVREKLQEYSGLEVVSDSNFQGKTCKIEWKNGGAVVDLEAYSKNLCDSILQTLDEPSLKGHDKE